MTQRPIIITNILPFKTFATYRSRAISEYAVIGANPLSFETTLALSFVLLEAFSSRYQSSGPAEQIIDTLALL